MTPLDPAWATETLFVVTGAPGSGKTTVATELRRRSNGSMVICDIDDLLIEVRLLGIPIAGPGGAPVWPEYNAMWVRLLHMVRRSGVSVLLLCPLLPDELPENDVTAWLLLDCSESERRRRLAALDVGSTGLPSLGSGVLP